MDGPINVKVIVGSTRQNRFSDKPAHWIFEEVGKKSGVNAELLDLRDYPMPFFDDPKPPAASGGKYANETVQKWALKIKDADAFIIVTPEYNHGYPGVLKNALDSIYPEWNRKAVGFVSYGGVSGARSVEQLRQVIIELQMIPINKTIHIPVEIFAKLRNEKAPIIPEFFDPIKKSAGGDRVEAFLNELIWMARTLKTARESSF